ncbi:MAG: MauE/DoxX family redox-associated membrane protein [bacterium]|nr:MauE/DoxX family redox-associated membrane protein [bacterium]
MTRGRSAAVLILRFAFAVILGWASIDKILHPWAFSQDIVNYRVIGDGLSAVAAIWLPYLELFTAVCLLAGLWLDGAVLVNAGLMWLFLILVLQAFFRRLDIHCGCFTVKGESVIGPLKIAENAAFAAGSLALLLLEAGLKNRRVKNRP